MAEQFELQSLLNDKVKNIVGHTSLNFSPEDSERLKYDDELMLQNCPRLHETDGNRKHAVHHCPAHRP